MSVSDAFVNLCVGYGLVVIAASRLDAIVALLLYGLGFLDHTINLISLRSLSHECKWCY